MNEGKQAVTVDLDAWRAYRRETFGCDHDSFRNGRNLYEVTRDTRGNVLVAQGMMSHWIPMRFVRYAEEGAA